MSVHTSSYYSLVSIPRSYTRNGEYEKAWSGVRIPSRLVKKWEQRMVLVKVELNEQFEEFQSRDETFGEGRIG